MAHTQADVLNPAGRGASLAAIEGWAASGAEALRIGDTERLDAVTAEDAGAVAWIVGDLGVVGVAVIGEGSAAVVIVDQLIVQRGRSRSGNGARDGLQ